MSSDQTPLRFALKSENFKIVEFLVLKGAYYIEINQRNNKICNYFLLKN
jgi:hypothetical protein